MIAEEVPSKDLVHFQRNLHNSEVKLKPNDSLRSPTLEGESPVADNSCSAANVDVVASARRVK